MKLMFGIDTTVRLIIGTILYTAVRTMLWILGWIVIPLAAVMRAYETRYVPRFGRSSLQWRWRWMWPWGNEEDGIDGMRPWDWGWINPWFIKTAEWSEFRRIVHWSAWRNPVNNLRFTRPFGFLIQPEKIDYIGNSKHPRTDNYNKPGTYWFLARHGWYTAFGIITLGWRFRLGWRFFPSDADGLTDPDDARAKGCGFTLQFGRADWNPNTGSPSSLLIALRNG